MKPILVVWLLMTGPSGAEVDKIVAAGGNLGTSLWEIHHEYSLQEDCEAAAAKLENKLRSEYVVYCAREERPLETD